MGLLSPRGSQITTTTVAGTGFAMIMTREWCLLVLEFFLCFFFDQGIGSRSAAWASRVDVVWVSVCVSSVVGCCSYVRWCCIRVALYASCMYPRLLCNVDVMISTLQKRLQDALLSLVGPSSSFRIGSHLGRDNYIITSKMLVHCTKHQYAFFHKTPVVIDPCRSNSMCKN